MIMVDTSVWIDYFNGNDNPYTQKLDEILVLDIVVIGDIILTEILQGFRRDEDFKHAKAVLAALDCFELCGRENAIKSAENFRSLRKMGITVRKTTDIIIGTFCIINNLPLLFADHDFTPLKEHLGLKSAL